MSGYSTIRLDIDGPRAEVVLDRPAKRNAIDWAMWNELLDAIVRVEADANARVLVVSGADGSFCSGADLSAASPPIHPIDQLTTINHVVARLHSASVLTIAKVDGDAVGAGCNLALACDLAVASDRSRFAEIFVRRGMSVDCGGSWLLPRLVGLQRAKELCLTGRFVSGEEAARLGMVLCCVSVGELDTVVDEFVEALVAGAPIAQLLTKRLVDQGFGSSLQEALDNEAMAQVVNISSSDAPEAKAAFLERRSAVFSGGWRPPR